MYPSIKKLHPRITQKKHDFERNTGSPKMVSFIIRHDISTYKTINVFMN